MAVQSPSVLYPEDLNETDREILAELDEGRVTPALVAERRDLGRSYVSQRLIRLAEHGHVDELVRGLYELVADPRDQSLDEGADPGPRVRMTHLENQLEELHGRRQLALGVLDRLEAAYDRGDSETVEWGLNQIRAALGGNSDVSDADDVEAEDDPREGDDG